ncbi:MAG: hypothetical protein JO199_13215, partial [Candidatus Eremiobacteraeota bacterium]|nr:hypothetical protein [Candidatus Eremiobacteraeota bacterium]
PQQTDNLGWYAVEGAPSYAPGANGGAYERAARALDPQFVADTARRYLRGAVTVNLIVAPAARESTS